MVVVVVVGSSSRSSCRTLNLNKTAEEKVERIKDDIRENLKNIRNNFNIQKQSNAINISQNEHLYKVIPKKERELLEISRQHEIKNNIYTYLLQKREESAISLSASISNAKIIDAPKALLVPVLPNKDTIYLVTLLIGLFIPLSLFYLIELMNNKNCFKI